MPFFGAAGLARPPLSVLHQAWSATGGVTKPTRLRLIRLNFRHAAPRSASLDSGTGLAHRGTGGNPLGRSPGPGRGGPSWGVDRFGAALHGADGQNRSGHPDWTAVASPCRSFLRRSSGRSPAACTRAAASRGPGSLRSRRARPHGTPFPPLSNWPSQPQLI
jgi:hypothetical protein